MSSRFGGAGIRRGLRVEVQAVPESIPAPTAINPPSVSPAGPVDVGDTLTPTAASFVGADTVSYQWEHVSNPGVSVGAGTPYTTQSGDGGESLIFVAIGSNAGGSTRAESNAVAVNTAVTDFRLEPAYAGHVSFRRAADGEGGVEDHNVTKADGDTTAQELVDLISGVVLDAPAAGQRPVLAANGGMDGSSLALLQGTDSTIQDALANNVTADITFAWVVQAPAAWPNLEEFIWSLNATATSGRYQNFGWSRGSYGERVRQADRGSSVDNFITDTNLAPSVGHVIMLRYTAATSSCRVYVDGVAHSAEEPVTIGAPFNQINLFGIGGPAPGGGISGVTHELFAGLAAFDEATIAALTGSFQAYWQGRGVTFA